MTTSPQQAVRPPTIDDMRQSISRVIEADFDTTWSSLCSSAGVREDAHNLDDASMASLLQEISEHDRLCRVMAMSWKIRRTAARKMAELDR